MIYVGMSTKSTYVKMCGRNYVAKNTHMSVLGSQNGPVPYYSFLLYARAALAWTKKKPKKCSLRNEKLKANRASETEEQRKERLTIRHEKDRARRTKKKTRKGRQKQKNTRNRSSITIWSYDESLGRRKKLQKVKMKGGLGWIRGLRGQEQDMSSLALCVFEPLFVLI